MAAVAHIPVDTSRLHHLDTKGPIPLVTTAEIDVSENESDSEDAIAYNPSVTHLITSPYPDSANQTRLTDLSTSCRMLSFALTQLVPIRSDYATAPYMESFNWSVCFEALRRLCSRTGVHWQRQELYVVIFRSKLKPNADRTRLGELDQHSHAEACQSGGLLKYWFGSCDTEMRNLATCLWRSRDDAVAGGKGPWHAKAMRSAVEMYEEITFHRHTLMIDDGATSWRLQDYVAPDK